MQDRFDLQVNEKGARRRDFDEPALFPFGTLFISSLFFSASHSSYFCSCRSDSREVIPMSISVLPVQPVNAQSQTQPAAQPAKTAPLTAVPQDKVTISPQAQQALSSTAKQAAGGDVDHDGDNH
jgi:hypothetical protein